MSARTPSARLATPPTTPPADQPARPGWLVRWLAALPIGGSLLLSFAGLSALADASRIVGHLIYLWPLSLDAAGAVATLVWLNRALAADARRAARRLALATIVLSVAGNSLWHWLIETGNRPHVVVQMIVGAVPPLVLFAMLHVLVAAFARTATEPATPRPASQPADQPPTTTASQPARLIVLAGVTTRPASDGGVLSIPLPRHLTAVPNQPATPEPAHASQSANRQAAPTRSWAAHLDAARQIIASQPGIGRPALAAALGIPESQARQIIDHLRAASQPTLLEAAP